MLRDSEQYFRGCGPLVSLLSVTLPSQDNSFSRHQAPSLIVVFPGCEPRGCFEGRYTSFTEPAVFGQLAKEDLVVSGSRETLIPRAGCVYFRLDSVFMEKNRVGFGSIGPNGGVSLLPFRCFPCTEGPYFSETPCEY